MRTSHGAQHLLRMAKRWDYLEQFRNRAPKNQDASATRDHEITGSSSGRDVENTYLYAIGVIAVNTAMRKGELLGLSGARELST